MPATLSLVVDSHCPAYPATPWACSSPQSAPHAPGRRNHVYYTRHVILHHGYASYHESITGTSKVRPTNSNPNPNPNQVFFAGIAGLSSGRSAATSPAASPPPPLPAAPLPAAKAARPASARVEGSLAAGQGLGWLQETHVDVVLSRLSLACHGETSER